jgi:hypothetical protein
VNSVLMETTFADILEHSHSIRERAEYNKGEKDVGAPESPIHLQPALQFPRYRIYVSKNPRVQHLQGALTNPA